MFIHLLPASRYWWASRFLGIIASLFTSHSVRMSTEGGTSWCKNPMNWTEMHFMAFLCSSQSLAVSFWDFCIDLFSPWWTLFLKYEIQFHEHSQTFVVTVKNYSTVFCIHAKSILVHSHYKLSADIHILISISRNVRIAVNRVLIAFHFYMQMAESTRRNGRMKKKFFSRHRNRN